MITFDRDRVRFTLRVAGIALHHGCVLLHRGPTDDFWTLPGGRCELNEATSTALVREMQEELGIEVVAERLLWPVENFFEYQGYICHEIGFYYLMAIPDDSSVFDRGDEFIGDEGGSPLYFRWHRLDNLGSLAIYPTFLKHRLFDLPDGIEHVIHVDGEEP